MRYYVIQILDGYADGKPSWRRWSSKSYSRFDAARERIEEILQYKSNAVFRIRMKPQ